MSSSAGIANGKFDSDGVVTPERRRLVTAAL
jgi:hypothetical protein